MFTTNKYECRTCQAHGPWSIRYAKIGEDIIPLDATCGTCKVRTTTSKGAIKEMELLFIKQHTEVGKYGSKMYHECCRILRATLYAVQQNTQTS
jgi:hypothetical protein